MPNFHEVLATLTVISGTVMALGYYPQAYRLWQKKDAEAMSLATYVVFATGNLVWLAYCIDNEKWSLAIPFLIGTPGSCAVLGLVVIYRTRKR